MRIPQSYLQKVKVVAHIFQALFVFVATILTLIVVSKQGPTGGATKFFIALCFLSIIPIIYQTMVPMWSRAERFANATAFLAVDAVMTLLWFAAFISVAMWNSEGIKEGATDKKVENATCATFKFGSESKCSTSKTSVGIGAVIFLLFAITTTISGYHFVKFKKEGVLPYETAKQDPHHLSGETTKDNAWSTEIETGRRGSADSVDRFTEHGGDQQEDEHALLESTETDEGRHPARPVSWASEDRTGYGRPVPTYAEYKDDNVSALSPGGYDDYRRDAGHSQHSRLSQGYSFSGGSH